MDTQKKQLTELDRFMLTYNIGMMYAGHGTGLFPVYADAREAFAKASKNQLYKHFNFTEYDFRGFGAGYGTMKQKLHAVYALKEKAQEDAKKILADIGYNNESYVYDKDKPAPFDYSQGCLNQGCGKSFDDCKCSHFKPTKNPAYDWANVGA